MFKRPPETQNYDPQDHLQKRTKKDAQKKRRKAPQTPKTPDISDDGPNFVKKSVSKSAPSTRLGPEGAVRNVFHHGFFS
jgi:hypothetical protein